MHDIRSVTKSIGTALAQGSIKSLDTPVLDFFPEYSDLRTPERERITLAHLLTMTPGLEWDESGSYARLGNSETQMRFADDPDRFVLERKIMNPAGARFQYNGGATALIGEVLVRSSGMPLQRGVLLSPLQIRNNRRQKPPRFAAGHGAMIERH